MKLSTLRGWFQNRARETKLYVIDGSSRVHFLLSGFASNPRADGEVLRIDVGPYVVYSFQRDDTLRRDTPFLGLRLDPRSRITRKFQTHRRNVLKLREAQGRRGLERYLDEAWLLRSTRSETRATADPPVPRASG